MVRLVSVALVFVAMTSSLALAQSCEEKLAVTEKMVLVVRDERDRLQMILSQVLANAEKKKPEARPDAKPAE